MSGAPPTPGRVGDHAWDVVVLGAGVIGLCCAHELRERGVGVAIVDRAGPGAGASSGNAGLISLAHPPLPRRGLVMDLIRSLFARGMPARLVGGLITGVPGFLSSLARAGSASELARTMEVVAELSRMTAPLFRGYAELLGDAIELRESGYMDVYQNRRLFDRAREVAGEIEALGFTERVLTAHEARDLEPALRPGLVGAIRHEESGVANPGAFVSALARSLERRGAALITGREARRIVVRDGAATGVELEDGEVLGASKVVLAAGIGSVGLARTAGLRVPMLSGKGYHVMVEPRGEPIRNSVHLGGTWLACTSMGGSLRIAGLLDLGPAREGADQRRIDSLLPTASRFLAGLENAPVTSSWHGHRPCTADGLPVIGEHPGLPGLVVSTGHAMMGFWTGPATGRLVAQAIVGEPASCPMEPFRPDRFGPVRPPREPAGSVRFGANEPAIQS